MAAIQSRRIAPDPGHEVPDAAEGARVKTAAVFVLVARESLLRLVAAYRWRRRGLPLVWPSFSTGSPLSLWAAWTTLGTDDRNGGRRPNRAFFHLSFTARRLRAGWHQANPKKREDSMEAGGNFDGTKQKLNGIFPLVLKRLLVGLLAVKFCRFVVFPVLANRSFRDVVVGCRKVKS